MKVAAQRKWAWPQVQLLKSLILVLMCNLLSLQGTLGKPAVHSGTSACFGHNRHSVQYLGYKVRQVHTQDTIHIYKEQPILKFQAIGSNWVFCIYGMETSRFKIGEFQWTFSYGEFSWTLFVHENSSSWVNFRGHIFGEFQWTLFDGDNKQCQHCWSANAGGAGTKPLLG